MGQWRLGNAGGILDLWYRTGTNEPALRQLQPFADNSNPLRIYVGNPELGPEYHHDLTVGYLLLRPYSEVSLGADIRTSYTQNSIISVRTIDADLRQRISAVNADAVWMHYGGLTYRMPIRRLRIKWGAGIDGVMETETEIINSEENKSEAMRGRVDFKITYRHSDTIEVIARAARTYNRVRYSLNRSLNQSYTNSTLDVDAFCHFANSWSLESSLQHRILDRDIFGSGHKVFLLNLSLSRLLWGGRGYVDIALNDALNQNQVVRFINAATYLQEERIVSLGRHVMIKLTYKPRVM